MQALQSGCALRLLSVFITGVGLLSMRLSIMGRQAPEFSPSDNPAANCESSLTRLLTFLFLPAFNFWLLLSPRVLSFDWSMDAIPLLESFLDLRCLVIVLFYGFFAFLGFYSLIKCIHCCETSVERNIDNKKYVSKEKFYTGHRKDQMLRNGKKHVNEATDTETVSLSHGHCIHLNNNLPMRTFNVGSTNCLLQTVLLSLAILTLPFLPASNLFFYVGFVVAERILYIPSVGYCLLIAVGADIICKVCNVKQRKFFIGFLMGMLVLLCAKAVQRNMDWQNEEALYRY